MVKSNTAGSLLLMKGFPLAGSGKANIIITAEGRAAITVNLTIL